ncbi:hypothetical protein QM007_10095 [Rothia sp. SD9660Na]|uniref:hypothetical protein n=1 Tax=Rothia sp. SD9660Na TaxID=3047030 RepID=UPI0024B9BEE1|nr:hypothetical protein [Rothia sp. SD9660Na]WHS51542.1 hypothetical protein QM007_10095 [Rothia sp. SD9660Na]
MVNRIPAILGGSPLYATVAFVGACEVALVRGAVGPAGAGHGSFYCDLPGRGHFGAVAPLAAAEAGSAQGAPTSLAVRTPPPGFTRPVGVRRPADPGNAGYRRRNSPSPL